MRNRPVGTDSGEWIRLTDWHHDQASNERGAVSVNGKALFSMDVCNDDCPVHSHAPSCETVVLRKALALEDWARNFRFYIMTLIAFFNDEGSAVCATEIASSLAKDAADLFY